ncbi:MAG TPA: ABC transporter permease [Micrococcales bacterium]|uniref:ABC transporter permease n=3 Tax=Brevibacterium casei TaxID=33889 RepID=K9AIT3_9MICO|nr:ABC transporter permease [Brevibacterium casei]NJE66764.1 ABC transporter permease [Brevibacterium sp. LS14]HCX86250.1 ABC transporter permease [Micrococcales bacterium]EKU47204.1 ABC transporter permease [Brevibacterium casei S18]KZE17931.1 spermidine/putrescine ABC transporter permease [Brevibacterium casei]MBE4693238.1 ABC transporter permease [Brevibacterium casei]
MSKKNTFARRTPTDIGLNVWGILVFIYLFIPIAVIIAYSFNTGRVLAAFRGFGLDAYITGLNNDIIISSVVTSLQAAVGAAIVSTVFGTLGGVALARAPKGAWWALGLTGLLALTLVTPEIVDGISFLPWFVTLGVDWGITPINNGLVRLIISHAMFSMAIVTFIVRARLAGIDTQLEDAAADLGATPWRRFRDITLPIAAPGILAGALMSFTVSLDNTILSSFVQQPGYTPWPVYIFSAVRVALRPEVAAISTVMFVLTLAALAFVGFVLRRAGSNSTEIIKTMAG